MSWLDNPAAETQITHRSRLWLYVLAAACLLYGTFLVVASRIERENALTSVVRDLESMSGSMLWLAIVQFCSWFTMFAIFTYMTPAIVAMHFGDAAPGTAPYEAGGNWVGALFSAYNAFGAIAALIIPFFVRRFGMRRVHLVNLWIGAAGLLSMMWIRDLHWLLASMAGFGVAWASMVSLPYAMLANNLPSRNAKSPRGW